jgi:hypothetical protein
MFTDILKERIASIFFPEDETWHSSEFSVTAVRAPYLFEGVSEQDSENIWK